MAHVRKLERGDGTVAYEVRWRDGGKFRQRTFKVARQADRFALKIENELAEGTTTDPYVKRSTTVAEVVEASMAVAAGKLKPRTLASYRQIYDSDILPRFGSKKIAAVTSQDVEKWVQDLAARGLSPATVRNHYVSLNKVFRYAARHRLIAANPCAGTELPKETGTDAFHPTFLTPDEVERLARELDAFHPYGLLVRFAAYTGLRAGEIGGLRVRDVNLLRRQVEVRQTLQRTKGEWIVSTPKSARSSRNVPLRADLLAALEAYLAAHPLRHDPEARLWPGRKLGPHTLDWTRPMDQSSFLRNYYKPALKRAGLPPMRFHDLRHTYASIMAASGIDIYKVSRWMGHANVATTDGIYTHLFAHDAAEDMARVEAFVARG